MDIRELLCESKEDRDSVSAIFGEIKKEFSGSSDRGITVIAASMIDLLMEDLLETFFVPFESKTDRKNIFSSNGPLSNISNKIEMAFSLGLLSTFDKKLLKTLISVRNKFAHQIGGISFQSDEVIQKCKQLIIPDDLLVAMDIGHKIGNRTVIYKPRKEDYRGWFQTATYVAITILAHRKMIFLCEKRHSPDDIKHRSEFSKENIISTKALIELAKDTISNKDKYNLASQKLERLTYLLNRLKLTLAFHETQEKESYDVEIIEK